MEENQFELLTAFLATLPNASYALILQTDHQILFLDYGVFLCKDVFDESA